MNTGWHPEVEAWFRTHTFGPHPPAAGDLVASKQGSITACLPALDEAGTIGGICRVIADELMRPGLVDELLVIDSGSSDDTIDVARAAGATVHRATDILPDIATGSGGKGDSLWKSLALAQGDIIVWLDSDTRNFHAGFVTALVAPLLEDGGIHLVKAFYERPLVGADECLPAGGARVTEIAVRPLINLFFPKLAGFVQPLAGEFAARTETMRSVPFATGYAVDISLLIDVVETLGLDAVAQADLGKRVHRNRAVPELGRMSFEIMQALFLRLDDDARVKLADALPSELIQFVDSVDGPVPTTHRAETTMRPPLRNYLS